MKKYVDYWMYGVGIGMFWYLLALQIWNVGGQGFSQILVTVIGSGLMGLSGLIYDNEGRPAFWQSLLHFILILSIVLGMTTLNGWVAWDKLSYIGIFVVQFLIIYLIVWTILYQVEKAKIRRINEKLRKKSS